jgi:hypothetical protein
MSAGSIVVRNHNATGDIVLGSGSSLEASAAGTNLVLVSGRNFVNNSGSSAPLNAGSGRWLVYATDPADNTLGGMTADFKRYACTYGGSCPALGSGNGLLYSVTPSLTVTADDKSRTYGAANPSLTYGVSGFIDGDTEGSATSGAASLSTLADTSSNVGTYDITVSIGTLASELGYQFSLADGMLTVDPAVLSILGVTADNKVYDGTTVATLDSGSASLSGVIGGDTVNLDSGSASGSFADKNVGTGKAVTASGFAISGADSGNYTLDQPAGLTADITAKQLTALLTGTVSKTYDGTTDAALASGNYSLAGVIAGDTVALNNPASGSYDTKNVGTGKTVSVNGLTLSGADASNYTLASSSINGAVGDITAKQLTASLTGTVSKTYDGTTLATLAQANYSLSGVLGADAVALNFPSTGTYDTAAVGTGKTVSVTGLALLGAEATNYQLAATSINGTVGRIDAAPASGSSSGSSTALPDDIPRILLASASSQQLVGRQNKVSFVPYPRPSNKAVHIATGDTTPVTGPSETALLAPSSNDELYVTGRFGKYPRVLIDEQLQQLLGLPPVWW